MPIESSTLFGQHQISILIHEPEASCRGSPPTGRENLDFHLVTRKQTKQTGPRYSLPLLAFPNKVLFEIADCLLQSPTCICGCNDHHISPHISAFSRSNHRLHALLSEYLLATASTPHILFWVIANNRPDTVALALNRGADPNTILRPDSHLTTSMRAYSVDAKSHALKLATLTLLVDAGGTCAIHYLHRPTRDGDLDLLTLCLPHLTPEHEQYRTAGRRTLRVGPRPHRSHKAGHR